MGFYPVYSFHTDLGYGGNKLFLDSKIIVYFSERKNLKQLHFEIRIFPYPDRNA